MNASPKVSKISASSTLRHSARSTSERGRLILVVGPSGVGKDTLIEGAKAALAGEPMVFPRREITRPDDPDGEGHLSLDVASFAARAAAGAYALSWCAHGLNYGVPVAIDADLAAGRSVVVNVSRTVIPTARERYRPLRIISITADARRLGVRLAARGRETAEDVAARLARADQISVSGDEVVEVANDGSVAEGVAAMLAAIRL